MHRSIVFACALGLAGLMMSSPSLAADPRLEEAQRALRANDYPRAVQLLRPLAQEGVAQAQFTLGVMYQHGQGVARDARQAVDLLGRAAAAGHAEAQAVLGIMLYDGDGVPADQATGFRHLRQAAERGSVTAQAMAGSIQLFADGPHRDHTAGLLWLQRAAEQGSARARYSLGLAYRSGTGVVANWSEAVGWWRKAAEADHAGAQYYLGISFLRGEGVAKDLAEGVRWVRRSADAGHARAQRRLGALYRDGEGVPKDEAAAVKYYQLAAGQGDEEAKKQLAALRQSMAARPVTQPPSPSVRVEAPRPAPPAVQVPAAALPSGPGAAADSLVRPEDASLAMRPEPPLSPQEATAAIQALRIPKKGSAATSPAAGYSGVMERPGCKIVFSITGIEVEKTDDQEREVGTGKHRTLRLTGKLEGQSLRFSGTVTIIANGYNNPATYLVSASSSRARRDAAQIEDFRQGQRDFLTGKTKGKIFEFPFDHTIPLAGQKSVSLAGTVNAGGFDVINLVGTFTGK
ncbi:MAG: hypothetical protein WC713_05235 [Candidatus Methylomirabilota bacterium]